MLNDRRDFLKFMGMVISLPLIKIHLMKTLIDKQRND
jgi:hypothetical protein